jgi:hypothetical protein
MARDGGGFAVQACQSLRGMIVSDNEVAAIVVPRRTGGYSSALPVLVATFGRELAARPMPAGRSQGRLTRQDPAAPRLSAIKIAGPVLAPSLIWFSSLINAPAFPSAQVTPRWPVARLSSTNRG